MFEDNKGATAPSQNTFNSNSANVGGQPNEPDPIRTKMAGELEAAPRGSFSAQVVLPRDVEDVIEGIIDSYGEQILGAAFHAMDTFAAEFDDSDWYDQLNGLSDLQRDLVVSKITLAVAGANEPLLWSLDTAFIDARDDLLADLEFARDQPNDRYPLFDGKAVWFKHKLADGLTLLITANLSETGEQLIVGEDYGDHLLGFPGAMVIEVRDFGNRERGTIARLELSWADEQLWAKEFSVAEEYRGKNIMNCLLAMVWKMTNQVVITSVDSEVIDAL